MEKFVQLDKTKLNHIPISEFADFIHQSYEGSKTEYLIKCIEKWILDNYNKTIHANDLMPTKKLMSDLLDISTGTVQNIYRNLEDKGLLYSKQCIGTVIADINNKSVKLRKSVSKKDYATELIKKFIIKNKFKTGEQLPSARAISQYIGISINTTRVAMENLIIQGIIEKTQNKDQNWILKTNKINVSANNSNSLISNIVLDIKKYITQNLRIGDKMPTHAQLAKNLKVSVKTIHDSLEYLISEGILLPKRGRYGTCVVKMPDDTKLQPQAETSIFAKSQITARYHYERIQDSIKNMILEKYSLHSKLPSIMEMSNLMDVSPNTIRKAFANLAEEGYLTFTRGRYGGTFVKAMPKSPVNQPFEWVAVNPKYATYSDN